jgi:hypothetical protein
MSAGSTVCRIPGDSGHGRARGAGQKKENDEGIRFYTLLVAETRRGGRISPEKMWRLRERVRGRPMSRRAVALQERCS